MTSFGHCLNAHFIYGLPHLGTGHLVGHGTPSPQTAWQRPEGGVDGGRGPRRGAPDSPLQRGPPHLCPCRAPTQRPVRPAHHVPRSAPGAGRAGGWLTGSALKKGRSLLTLSRCRD